MLSFGTIALMAISMLVSLGVYTLAFEFNFAIGFILLLFCHEIGHVIASRVVGLKASNPLFVPFVGAVINLSRAPVNAKMEANVAIGGPAMGTISALVCLLFYFWSDSFLMLILAYTSCLLNLFNLIPCVPLDGAKIAGAISPAIWWLGSVVLGVMSLYTHNPFILIIFLFSLFTIWRKDGKNCGSSPNYYRLTGRQRVKVACWYFGLLLVLSFMTLYIVELLH
jgi:Zn-dependent protease